MLHLFRPITPGFLVAPMVPLFVAWFFYMARFYVMPPLLGLGAMGTLSFPLESDIARAIGALLGENRAFRTRMGSAAPKHAPP